MEMQMQNGSIENSLAGRVADTQDLYQIQI